MNLFKAAHRACQPLLSSIHHGRGNASLLQGVKYLRTFSTEAGTANEPPSQDSHSSIDSFLQTPSSGFVYAKLSGDNRFALKTDVISMFEGCNLTPDDIKVYYNRLLNPVYSLVQFPAQYYYGDAVRSLVKKGRFYKLERSAKEEWDAVEFYNGKYVVIQGIPPKAGLDDIFRFLQGFDYDPSSLDLFTRGTANDPIRMAKVRFHSQTEAASAAIRKNRAYLLNDKMAVRVLQ